MRIIAIVLIAMATPALAESTVQRDAPTTRFYSRDGKTTGSASRYGTITKFYTPDGRLLGSATHNQRKE